MLWRLFTVDDESPLLSSASPVLIKEDDEDEDEEKGGAMGDTVTPLWGIDPLLLLLLLLPLLLIEEEEEALVFLFDEDVETIFGSWNLLFMEATEAASRSSANLSAFCCSSTFRMPSASGSTLTKLSTTRVTTLEYPLTPTPRPVRPFDVSAGKGRTETTAGTEEGESTTEEDDDDDDDEEEEEELVADELTMPSVDSDLDRRDLGTGRLSYLGLSLSSTKSACARKDFPKKEEKDIF